MLDLSNPQVRDRFASHIIKYEPRVSYSVNLFTLLLSIIVFYSNKFPKRKIRKFFYKYGSFR